MKDFARIFCKIVLRLVQVSIFCEGSSLVIRTGSPQQLTYFQMKRPKGNQFTSGTRSVLVPKDSPGYEPENIPDGQTVSGNSTAVS